MRIKRFIAPDMRAALKMVRDEQGPDAVILSNRPTEGGIEVVAATDYDEALVQQALRTAAPTLKPLQAKVIEAAEAAAPARPAARKPSARRWPTGANGARAPTTPAKAYSWVRWSAWSIPTARSNTSFSARMGAA